MRIFILMINQGVANMITIDELKFKLGGLETAVNDLRDALSIEASEKRLAELEHQMTMPGFYDDQEKSQKVISEMGEVKNKLEIGRAHV